MYGKYMSPSELQRADTLAPYEKAGSHKPHIARIENESLRHTQEEL